MDGVYAAYDRAGWLRNVTQALLLLCNMNDKPSC